MRKPGRSNYKIEESLLATKERQNTTKHSRINSDVPWTHALKFLDIEEFSNILKSYESKTKGKNIILSINFMRLGLPNFPISIVPKMAYELLKVKSLSIQTYSKIVYKNNYAYFSRYNTPITKGLSSISIHAFRKYPMYRLLSLSHSFTASGPRKMYNHVFTSAYGKNSTFAYYLTAIHHGLI